MQKTIFVNSSITFKCKNLSQGKNVNTALFIATDGYTCKLSQISTNLLVKKPVNQALNCKGGNSYYSQLIGFSKPSSSKLKCTRTKS